MKLIHMMVCATALLSFTNIAHAGDTRAISGVSIEAGKDDGPERVAPRQLSPSRKPYLLSTNRLSEMMLKDDAVYLQFTDYGLKQIGNMEDTRQKDDGVFGNMIKAMALSGVRQLLDHSLAVSLSDMRTARVRDGEVVLVTCKGKEVFNNVKINGQVQKFPQDQAEEFVRSVNRLRERALACGR